MLHTKHSFFISLLFFLSRRKQNHHHVQHKYNTSCFVSDGRNKKKKTISQDENGKKKKNSSLAWLWKFMRATFYSITKMFLFLTVRSSNVRGKGRQNIKWNIIKNFSSKTMTTVHSCVLENNFWGISFILSLMRAMSALSDRLCLLSFYKSSHCIIIINGSLRANNSESWSFLCI